MVHTRRVNVVDRGEGTPVLLLHGTATDSTTWIVPMAGLRRHPLRLIAFDRGSRGLSVADHVRDALGVLDARGVARAVLCGSSYGAVVALELTRRHPERVFGAALCEPPLPCGDHVPPFPPGLGCTLDEIAAARGGAAAGELFLRIVLGHAAFEAMPREFRERACARWPEIRSDAVALERYGLRHSDLSAVDRPVLLLTGGRSQSWFRDTAEALAGHLPRARLVGVPEAGHIIHTEAPRVFNDLLLDCAERWAGVA